MLAKFIPTEVLSYFEYDEQSKSGLIFKYDIYDKNNKLRFEKGTEVGTIIRENGRVKQWQIFKAPYGKFAAHRVVWALVRGFQDVTKVIDHIDGNPLNNKENNLRLVSTTINNRNSKRDKRSFDNTLPNGVTCKEEANGSRTGYNTYFIVSYPENGKSKFKRYSVRKLGIMKAHLEAVKLRFSKEYDFSERHGK